MQKSEKRVEANLNGLWVATYLLLNTQITISSSSKSKLGQCKRLSRYGNRVYLYSKNPAYLQQYNGTMSETKYSISRKPKRQTHYCAIRNIISESNHKRKKRTYFFIIWTNMLFTIKPFFSTSFDKNRYSVVITSYSIVKLSKKHWDR